MTASNRNFFIPLILVISLFFLWAFVHNLEPIIIKHLRKACQLSYLQAMLIDSAVYMGYFLMALPAGIVMKKYGYKRAIMIGLVLYAFGALLFLPAASSRFYVFFLGALFIIASGCTFLETAANPYVTILGDASTATARLNFAQSFNGLGAAIAPYIGGVFILSGIEYSESELAAMDYATLNQYLQSEADSVKIPYLIIALVVLSVAIIIFYTSMPDDSIEQKKTHSSIKKAFGHVQLKWGVVAQFFYVGAQVCITSLFIPFAKFVGDTPEKTAASLLTLSMVGFMAGRFIGTFLMRFIEANRLLIIDSVISILLLCIAILVRSQLAMWAVFAVPFFESIMFPTIFALAINNIKEDTELGSSLVVMAIAGGALFPVLMGLISDRSNIQMAYIVPLLCFFVIAWYGWRGYKPSKV